MSSSESSTAHLEAIWRKIGRRGEMELLPRASLIEAYGLEGNADHGGARQITILDAGAWEAATAEIDVAVTPASRRANLLVRGIDLAETSERVLRVGGCLIQIRGETRPCGRMDQAAPGLREALAPDWRAGVYGMVLRGGAISVGDPVVWECGALR